MALRYGHCISGQGTAASAPRTEERKRRMLDNWYPAWSRESFRGTAFIQAQGYLVTWCEATVSDSPPAPGREKPVLLSSAKPHVSILVCVSSYHSNSLVSAGQLSACVLWRPWGCVEAGKSVQGDLRGYPCPATFKALSNVAVPWNCKSLRVAAVS